VIAGEQAFVSVERWLGPSPPPLDQDEALTRLAHRYLTGHGPATATDLARWAGVTLGRARRGFEAISDELEPFGDGFVLRGSPTATADGAEPPPPRLLGGFDPLLHGWADRTFVTGPHRSIVTTNGLFRPIALVDGRAVATWGLASGRVTLTPLEPIDPDTRAALDGDAEALLHYLAPR
jgi:hypothetical protein